MKDCIEFYKGWRALRFTVSPANYEDNKAQVCASPLLLLGIVLLPIIGLWALMIAFVPYGRVYIKFPIKSKVDHSEEPDYGFYFDSWDGGVFTDVVLCWNQKKKFVEMPWKLDWIRTSCLKSDGTWENEVKGISKDFWHEKWNDILWSESYPYVYTLKCGEKQYRQAKLRVEEREWRPKWFKWTSLFTKTRKTINVDFNDEVGERTGSWKGGTVGCSYDMSKHELPYQTLKRMENERTFS